MSLAGAAAVLSLATVVAGGYALDPLLMTKYAATAMMTTATAIRIGVVRLLGCGASENCARFFSRLPVGD
jgi:hypothetical protein